MNQMRTIGPGARSALVLAAALACAALSSCGSGVPAESQSATDASRDGVVAALAALSLEDRVDVQAAIPAPEGVWVVSRPGTGAEEAADGCRLGPDGGRYPSEMICTFEYGEVLLLDESQERIIRAFPLPALPPDFLAITDDAVFCARNGSGGLPDSMLCRIDRDTFEMSVRVFPSEDESIVAQPCFYPPAGWSVEPGYLEVRDLVVDGSELRTLDSDGGWHEIDGTTLEVLGPAPASVAG